MNLTTRLGAVALLALLASGCRMPAIRSGANVTADKLSDKVPDLVKYADDQLAKANADPGASSSLVENGLVALEKARTLDPQSYEVAWKAARLCAWLADDFYDDKNKRANFSARGEDYAKAATALNPKGAEGWYYSGINQGFQATTKIVGGKFMVPNVRDAWKKAMAIDPSFDRGGPARNMGALYSEAPPWPASIGDPDKGVELLQQALKVTDWPQTHLLLGNALVKAEKYDEAKVQYKMVLDAQATPDDAHQLPIWQKKAKSGIDNAEKQAAQATGPQ